MSELEKRVEERFGVLPNFFRLVPETPDIIEKLWGLTILCPPYLRNVSSSTCRAFAPSATAFLVMSVSWWGLAVPLAIRLCVRKVLQTLLNFFDATFPADKNFSLA